MPTLIGIPAAAQMSGVSVRTLRRLIARGELPCFRAGSARVLKVRPRDVAALFERV
ncbi:MAG: helix-turn-helix domain-containing protein [Propionibacteriaceae bacterium]|jgi:excisionase family DNA binding protein|nr:helix-turn-helix domain-containing protein [Propionibacteriaceae bacterium]